MTDQAQTRYWQLQRGDARVSVCPPQLSWVLRSCGGDVMVFFDWLVVMSGSGGSIEQPAVSILPV